MQSVRFVLQRRELSEKQRNELEGKPGRTGSSGSDDSTLVEGREEDDNPFIVGLDDDESPQNWSLTKKTLVLLGLQQIAAVVTFASAVASPAYMVISEEFGVAEQVAYLSTSLYLVGFGVGALVFGPLSEMLGRQPVYTGALLAFSLFQLGAALSPNWYALAITRFFAGVFGAPPLSNAGGSIADMMSPTLRTLTFPVFAMGGFLGPTLAPTFASFIVSSAGGWRWTQGLCALWGICVFAISLFLLPETFAPALHELKAAGMNRQYKTDKFISPRFAKTGKKASFNWSELPRALKMFFVEPIVFLMTLYLTVVYFVLYSDLESYTLIYMQWNFTVNQTGLTFLALAIGVLIAGAVTPLIHRDYQKRVALINGHRASEKKGEDKVVNSPPPEARLIQLCYACWLVPISMFWIGFTTYPSISPWPSIVSGVLFGCGLLFTFITSYEYVIDVYGPQSASALAAMTCIRYIFSGGVIHATTPMYKAMTLRGGFSLLGGVSLALCVVPFALIRYGKKIRQRSKFTQVREDEPELGPVFL